MGEQGKIWTRLGILAAVAGAVAAPHAMASGTLPGQHLMRLAQGGEGGGEAGEGQAPAVPDGLAGASEDAAFAVHLGMARGHLNNAADFLAAGKLKDAGVQAEALEEEIYPVLAKPLAQQNIKGLHEALEKLSDSLKAQKTADANAAIAAALAICDAAEKGTKQTPDFAADVAVRLLKMAVADYAEGIKDGHVEEAVEYQDARAFILVALARLDGVKAALADKDAADELGRSMDAIAALVPSLDPPQGEVKPADAMAGLVAEVELSVSDLLTK